MKDEQRYSYTMLSVVIPYELRKKVKWALEAKGMTIREGITDILEQWLKREEKCTQTTKHKCK